MFYHRFASREKINVFPHILHKPGVAHRGDYYRWMFFGAGERFSAADVHVGSQIGWGLAFNSIEKRPAFETYCAGICERPVYRRAKAIDDALMPKEASRAVRDSHEGTRKLQFFAPSRLRVGQLYFFQNIKKAPTDHSAGAVVENFIPISCDCRGSSAGTGTC
jgi:hypothetical protein